MCSLCCVSILLKTSQRAGTEIWSIERNAAAYRRVSKLNGQVRDNTVIMSPRNRYTNGLIGRKDGLGASLLLYRTRLPPHGVDRRTGGASRLNLLDQLEAVLPIERQVPLV